MNDSTLSSTWSGRFASLHPRIFFLETWRELDKEAAVERQQRIEAGLGADRRPLLAFCSGAFFLALMEYVGMPGAFQDLVQWLAALEREGSIDGQFWSELRRSEWWELSNHAYWALWRVLGFLLLPMLVIKRSGCRIRDQNLQTEGFFEHLWIYLLAFAFVLLCVVGVSYTEGFSTYYPFYKQSHRSWFDFLLWESLYLLQFLSLEFFFRGWWLRAGKTMMGSHAIFAMIVPYVMIHFGKEFAETIGAIFAGVVLGTLAMRTRSIWGGFFVHALVAISMDVAALLQTTGLPHVFWPDIQ